ncbi:hypothetical protein BdWA1_002486 [Babesia duncani]|uniref:Uncharacterized protein n=1 Tax=Babesia duncani TaxID=323732 RepID=A0AAD9PJA6_9APIC|nr:hypothetical protein BdWA1_002486 [Babesia duncani]
MHRSFRRLAGGSTKPHWGDPPKHRWQPFLLDRTHYSEHPTYNGFVLLLRALRPKIEKALGATASTVSTIASKFYQPIARLIVRHNPDIRYQLVALVAFFGTTRAISSYFSGLYQSILDVEHLLQLGVADDLNEQGFFNSNLEDRQHRLKLFEKEQDRLNALWEHAIAKATISGSFDDLAAHVIPTSTSVATGVLPRTSWRFNMIPYGKDNEDAITFTPPSYEQPLRSMALNFTYNNLSGDWGDYINRQDNKSALLRPSRQMFTDVYIPPTK